MANAAADVNAVRTRAGAAPYGLKTCILEHSWMQRQESSYYEEPRIKRNWPEWPLFFPIQAFRPTMGNPIPLAKLLRGKFPL